MESWRRKVLRRLKRRGVKRPRLIFVGEYGDKTGRPHYHFILLGVDLTQWPGEPVVLRSGYAGWSCDFLTEVWPDGFNVVGAVSPASTRYVLSYCFKRVKEFARFGQVSEEAVNTAEVKLRNPRSGFYGDELMIETGPTTREFIADRGAGASRYAVVDAEFAHPPDGLGLSFLLQPDLVEAYLNGQPLRLLDRVFPWTPYHDGKAIEAFGAEVVAEAKLRRAQVADEALTAEAMIERAERRSDVVFAEIMNEIEAAEF